jgi:hypothetical protein
MIEKRILDMGRRMRGWKAVRIDFRENEMILRFERGEKSALRLTFKGIFASRDSGLLGSALAGFTVTDKGSYKEIDFLPPRGGILFHAEFMEIEID